MTIFKYVILMFLLFFNSLEAMQEKIQNNLQITLKSTFAKSLLINSEDLNTYYKMNKYKLFWFNENGLKSIALELLEEIKKNPILKEEANKIFKLNDFVEFLQKLNNTKENYETNMIKIDFLLTQIYDNYVNYLKNGFINWEKFEEELKLLDKEKGVIYDWERSKIKFDKFKLLINILKKDKLNELYNFSKNFYPNSNKLIEELNKLEEISKNGGFIEVSSSKTLRILDENESIKSIRKRLLQSGDLKENCLKKDPFCENKFEDGLKKAVISFQKRHGLYADGIIGANTIKYLNIPVEKKIEKIKLNLERMRWLPKDLGGKYVLVNIPEYELKIYENNTLKLKMPIIVGDKKHPTPIFSNELSFITLNPYWKIPNSIARKEIIPKIIKDPNYIEEKGIKIHEMWDPNSNELNKEEINWNEYLNYMENQEQKRREEINSQTKTVEKENDLFPQIRFIQMPSDENPLGRMKFMFPNKYSVYMHDTPIKSLFNKSQRAFSHGCIRVSKPKKLLEFLSNYDEAININTTNEILENSEEKDIQLTNKIPVHLVYLTSFIDEKGNLNFRDDIYNYDEKQLKYFIK